MPRQRFQRPEVYKFGKRPQWIADYFVYVQVDGREVRKHRTGRFGMVGKVSKADAQRACDELVARETGVALRADGGCTLKLFWSEVYYPVRRRFGGNLEAAHRAGSRPHRA